MIMDYETQYPGVITLHNDQNQHRLTLDDNRERVLITEVRNSPEELKQIFGQEGFAETSIEIKKPGQIGNGVLKNLSDEWDMHVRFLNIHDGLVAIDGEVETSRKWVEHNTGDNWISVIYEITGILQKYGIQFSIWHKKMKNYVSNILEHIQIKMNPIGRIEWKHVAIAAGIVSLIGLTIWGIKKYYDSKEKKS